MHKYSVFITAVFLSVSRAGWAANWDIEPKVRVSEIYTDNIELSKSSEAKSEYTTEVAPSVAVDAHGNRLDLGMFYRLQGLYYAKDSDRNDLFHQMNANAEVRLVPEKFKLNFDAKYDQQIVDPKQEVGFGNVSNANTTDVGTYQAAATYTHRINTTTQLEWSVRNQNIYYATNDRVDNQSVGSIVEFSQTSQVNKLNWNVRYDVERISYDDNRDDEEIVSATLTLLYQLRPTLELNGSAGYEDYDLVNNIEDNNGNNPVWNAGVKWEPNPRTTVNVNYGERFFGTAKSLNVNYKGKKLGFEAGTLEEVDSLRGLDFSSDVALPGATLPGAGDFTPLPEEDVLYIKQRDFVKLMFFTPKTNLSLMLFKEDRTYDNDQDKEKSTGGSALMDYKIGVRTTLNLNYVHDDTDFTDGSNAVTDRITLSAVQTISAKTVATLAFSHIERDSDNSTDYDANSVEINFETTF